MTRLAPAVAAFLWFIAGAALAQSQQGLAQQGLAQQDPAHHAQPDHVLNRYIEVGPAIIACWKPPAGTEGMELTLIFSVRRNGEILGKPRISFAKLSGDIDLQKRFVASTLAALAACTPLRISDALGGAIAGRPFTMLFHAVAREQRI